MSNYKEIAATHPQITKLFKIKLMQGKVSPQNKLGGPVPSLTWISMHLCCFIQHWAENSRSPVGMDLSYTFEILVEGSQGQILRRVFGVWVDTWFPQSPSHVLSCSPGKLFANPTQHICPCFACYWNMRKVAWELNDSSFMKMWLCSMCTHLTYGQFWLV